MARKKNHPSSTRRLKQAALAAAVLTALGGCGESQLTETEYLQRAQDYQEQGEMRAAIIELKNALALDPDNPDTRLQLGLAYLQAGIGDGAEKELRRAGTLGVPSETLAVALAESLLMQGKNDDLLEQIRPRDFNNQRTRAQLYALRAQALLNQGEVERAARELELADAENASVTNALLTHARLALSGGRMDEARKWIEQALATAPQSPDAWLLLGNLELAGGKTAEAETAFGKAIQYRSYPGPEVARRAMLRIRARRFDEADADIRRLTEAGLGQHPLVRYVQGMNYFAQGRFAEALEAFQQANSRTNALPSLNFYLSATHLALGHEEQALDFARRAYSQAPRSVRIARLLGALRIGYGDYDEGRAMLEKQLEQRPQDKDLLGLLAVAAVHEGDLASAIDYLERLLRLQPDSEQARNLLMLTRLMSGEPLGEVSETGEETYDRLLIRALAELRDGRLAQAIELARQLAETYPDKADPHKLIAATYLAAGLWGNAAEEFRAALKIAPSDPSATLSLARIEIHQGQLQDARTRLRALVEKNPGAEEAILLLAALEARLEGPERAIGLLQKMLESRPEAARVREELAAAELRAGRPDKVLDLTRDLDQATLLEAPRLLEYRGKAAMLLGDPVTAENAFQRWTRLQPDSAWAHFLLSEALAKRGYLDKAGTSLNRALTADPKFLPARIGEIKLLTTRGRLEEARRRLQALRGLAGANDPDVAAIEGWFALGTGAYEEAASRLEQALEARPGTELVILLARANAAKGNTSRALEILQDWLLEHPEDLAVAQERAEALMAAGQPGEAVAQYEAILAQQPNHLVALNNLAWLLQSTDPEKALALAGKAHDLAGDRAPDILDTYGFLLVRQGKAERGIRLLRKALELVPDNQGYRLHLAQALAGRPDDRKEARALLKEVVQKAPAPLAERARELLKTLP